MNYFELYEIPVCLQIDPSVIKPKYYELSRKYHPDFYSNASEEKQSEVLEKSSLVNKAFKVFNDPNEIIKYVLQLKGLLEEEEKYNLPSDFLMQIMELNEQLEEAGLKTEVGEIFEEYPESKMDITETKLQPRAIDVKAQARVSKLKSIISNFQHEIYEPVKQIVEHYQEGITTEKELLQVKEYYYKEKYLNRILAGMQ
jgi:molecular chaperone HscB